MSRTLAAALACQHPVRRGDDVPGAQTERIHQLGRLSRLPEAVVDRDQFDRHRMGLHHDLGHRAADQIRVTVAYTNLNVEIAGAHGGISVGPDGATHQAMEEISIIRSIPNMSMIVPCDYWETYKATVAAARHRGPVYIRFGREDVPVVTAKETPFTFGKGEVFAEGKDLTLIACGVMVYEALRARETLAQSGVTARVVDLHTVKPLDRALIERCARETGAIVTAEEHQVNGGLGGAVSEVVVQTCPVPMELVAVHDRFGQSGKPAELMDAFNRRGNVLTHQDRFCVE